MSEEAQIPAQRSGFAFLGHTPPPVSTLTYLLSVWVPARGQECVCVLECICVLMHVVECVFFHSNKCVKMNILRSITHRQTYISKRSSELLCFLFDRAKKARRCTEELTHQIKPCAHYSMHAILYQLRVWVGVQTKLTKKPPKHSFKSHLSRAGALEDA